MKLIQTAENAISHQWSVCYDFKTSTGKSQRVITSGDRYLLYKMRELIASDPKRTLVWVRDNTRERITYRPEDDAKKSPKEQLIKREISF